MILRTTRCRLDRMWKAVHDIEDYGLGLELSEAVGGDKPRSHVQIPEMCYAAGVRLRVLMIERCYRDGDKMRRGLSSSEFGALQDLAKATNEEARHPALRGIGMVGHVTRVFHAWNVGKDLWSPHPVFGGRWEILCPAWHCDEQQASTKITLWQPGGYCPASRLDDEALHWRFV